MRNPNLIWLGICSLITYTVKDVAGDKHELMFWLEHEWSESGIPEGPRASPPQKGPEFRFIILKNLKLSWAEMKTSYKFTQCSRYYIMTLLHSAVWRQRIAVLKYTACVNWLGCATAADTGRGSTLATYPSGVSSTLIHFTQPPNFNLWRRRGVVLQLSCLLASTNSTSRTVP